MREDIVALGERIAEQCVHLDAAMHRLLIDLHHFDQAGGWAMQQFQSCAHWLSWRVGWDLATARDRVRLANRLPALPKVRAKLEAGEISYSKARAIARVATPMNEEVLLLYAEHLPAAQLERVCGKLHTVEQNDRTRKEGHLPDRHERSVESRSLGDGMTCIKVVLQAEEAALLMNVIHTAAKTCTVSEDQPKRWNRADGLMAVAQTYARGESPDRTPIDLLITVPATALQASHSADSAESAAALAALADSAEAADSAASTRSERCTHSAHPALPAIPGLDTVAELPSGTCIGSETARRLACDAGIVEITVDDQGQPLSVGRKTRSIPPAIKRALLIRDRTCRYPGCDHRLFLDAHHIRHWADGGETSLANTLILCTSCHRRLHEQGYQISLDDHGHPTFLDPRGRPVVAVPPRPKPQDVGWMSILAANAPLDLDAETGACHWNGDDVDYGYAIDMILSAERRAEREQAQAQASPS